MYFIPEDDDSITDCKQKLHVDGQPLIMNSKKRLNKGQC